MNFPELPAIPRILNIRHIISPNGLFRDWMRVCCNPAETDNGAFLQP